MTFFSKVTPVDHIVIKEINNHTHPAIPDKEWTKKVIIQELCDLLREAIDENRGIPTSIFKKFSKRSIL